MLGYLMLNTVVVIVTSQEGTGNAKDLDLLPNMELFCPGKDICRRESNISTTAPKVAAVFRQCCTSCSCDVDCGRSMPCCFPSASNTVNKVRRRQECVNVSGLKQSSYYMVTRSLHDERIVTDIENKGLTATNETNCGAMVTGPWGSTAPVYSNTTGLIYKNGICAKQDSVKDIIPWNMYIECDWLDLKEKNPNSISQYFRLFNLLNQWNCYPVFLPPYEISSDLRSEICYNDIIRTCESGTSSRSLAYQISNIAEQEIKDACESAFYSPFRINASAQLYLNIFCYICNGNKYVEGRMVCSPLEVKSDSSYVELIHPQAALVDHKLLEDAEKRQGIATKTTKTLACDSEKKGTDSCRDVYCPAAQTYDHEGKCQFVLSEMPPLPLKIQLELKPVVEIHMSDLMTSSQNTNWLRSPWSIKWQIALILVSTSTQSGYERPHTLYVELLTYYKSLSVEQLVSELAYTLTKPFIICMNNGTCIEANQNFAKDNRFVFSDDFIAIPEWYDIMRREYILGSYPMQETDISINGYQVVFSDQDYLQQTGIDIKKHVLCHQVTLKENEYVFIKDANIMFLNKQSRLMLFLEFERILDTHNKEEVRICLEDSGLVPLTDSTKISGNYRTKPTISTLFISWLLLYMKILEEHED